jgi:choline dehydrogenase-like flavoprotein
MAFLNAAQQRTLAAICDTFAPSLTPQAGDDATFMQTSAAQMGLAAALETSLERVMDEAQRQQLGIFLTAIEQGIFNGVSVGEWGGFSGLALAEREALLRAWAFSDVPMARKTFQALKRLSLFLFYSLTPDEQPNPLWNAMSYPGGLPVREHTARAITPLEITGETTLTTDVLVIGSGAGGGVVAAELAAAGREVLIVEKGEYFAESDFDGRELAATERMFEKHGALTTEDLGVIVLAGSTLGGGTTVNWSASLRTPDYVLEEWAQEYGFSAATSPDFQASMEAVCSRMHVSTAEHTVNGVNRALEAGCQALGYDIKPVPRNVQGCEDCGFCNFGCAFGAKQGTLKTYLQDAVENGARVLVRAYVERVTQCGGLATGARLLVQGRDGALHPVRVRAKRVVVAAGSIHTPALLMRSRLRNPNIGANLHLHPTTVSYGTFEQAVYGWRGIPLSLISTEFANVDGRGYGARLECAPTHPGIAALVLAWNSGEQHRRVMQRLAHLANIIVITRDRGSGRVVLDSAGQPRLHYQLGREDAAHMLTGLKAAMRAHHAAGAVEIAGPQARYQPWLKSSGASFEAFLEGIRLEEMRPNRFALLSAHQMSSCRIAASPQQGALDPTGQTYEINNLYVTDASALPTATGVNPMLSIMALAHYLAQGIKARG